MITLEGVEIVVGDLGPGALGSQIAAPEKGRLACSRR